jgi:diaminopimelate epimerase
MIEFVKMHGLGNDFVVIDARRQPLDLSPGETRLIADRRYGVGCDQLIVLGPSQRGDAFMRIYNPDSSEVNACGNATRCIGQRLLEETGRESVTIETGAGLLSVSASAAGVTVDMGPARLEAAQIPLSVSVADTGAVPLGTAALAAGLPPTFSAVNMGNPHAIFFVSDVDAHQLERIGPLLETDPIFPERANISLVAVTGKDHLTQRVWERGAGLTLACGSGACAAAVAAHRAGLTGRKVTVTLPGGDLVIEWREDGHVLMTGGVARAFSGVFDPSILVRHG